MPSPVGALTKIKKMHSPLEKAVAAHKLESMPSAQWAAYIKANAPKSAKKEALAVKLDELLARQPKVTKTEIIQHIKDNSPKIKTKILQDRQYTAGDIDSHVNIEPDGSGGYNYLDANGDVAYNADSAKDMVNYLNEAEASNFPQYGEHVLPGGENYREMLLSLPRNPSQAMVRSQKVYEIKDANGQLLATGQLPMSPRTLQKVNNNPDWVVREFEQPNPNDVRRDPANFQSGHYDEPNILAHMRMNDRPTAEGKRALFLEELQSDWAQQGRKEGFGPTNAQKLIPAEIDELQALYDMGRGTRTPEQTARMNELNNRDNQVAGKFVPSGPYVEDTGDWTGLGLKKAIEHAVEQGHDSIAWTTGAQQADRYNLAKQVNRIEYHPESGDLIAYKEGAPRIVQNTKDQNELLELIGKDAADKLINSKLNSSGFKTIEGDDLRVGGEGMKGYYDQIVPQTANDILKSMGVTERVRPIGVQLHPNQIASQYESMGLTGRNPGDIIKPANISEQMGFQITPEIRDYVMNQGFPAFAEGGAVHMAHGGEVDYDELYEFKDYGSRETGEAKDTGALGEIRMPNGRDVMTEYSINVDGREMPSIVEGMHPADLNYIRETGTVPEDAVATAIRSANKREASGQSPFWNKKETFAQGGKVDYDAMYEFR